MMMKLFILTGGSRGMGLAIAQQLVQERHQLLCISRTRNDALTALALQTGAKLTQWTHDLADSASLVPGFIAWLRTQRQAEFCEVNLINNAGVLSAMAPLRQAEAADLNNALRVGLEAPLQLSAAFLQATQEWTIPRKILNVSSGLGRSAMASSASYCAAKAGMDHFSRCVALDEARKDNGAKICSLAPGVIATDMQVQLRGAPLENFPDQARFAALQEQGMLSSPVDAAARMLAYLARSDFGANPVADVREV
jgi:benzil reductase ((S)-benzoin forming)